MRFSACAMLLPLACAGEPNVPHPAETDSAPIALCDSGMSAPGTWYPDQDGDGYGQDSGARSACAAPEGYVPLGGDCLDDPSDPNSALTYPDAPEVCGDPDYNCDGVIDEGQPGYTDRDGDGYGDPTTMVQQCTLPDGTITAGGDCDDADPTIFPDAVEICDDGVINRCGTTAHEALTACGTLGVSDATATLLGPSAYMHLGYALAAADVTGDGALDLVSGANWTQVEGEYRGAVYVMDHVTPGFGPLTDPSLTLTGSTDSENAGGSVAAGDVDEDGVADLLIGAAYRSDRYDNGGAAYLVTLPAAGTLSLSEADLTLYGVAETDYAGSSVATGMDYSGDGVVDLVVGAEGVQGDDDSSGAYSGAAYVVSGANTGELALTDADTILLGEGDDNVYAGQAVALLDDMDGDGLAELAVGAPHARVGRWGLTGVLYVVPSGVTGTNDLEDVAFSLKATEGTEYVGCSVASAGDVDLDGHGDLVIGATGHNGLGGSSDSFAGAAYVVLGPVESSDSLDIAVALLIGVDDEIAGNDVAEAGDVDADGYPDLLIGAPGHEQPFTGAGAAYLSLGPFAGTSALQDAALRITGEGIHMNMGAALASGDVLLADGQIDLIIGAYGTSVTATNQGAVYVFELPDW